jgi:hypothetical protein
MISLVSTVNLAQVVINPGNFKTVELTLNLSVIWILTGEDLN